MQDGFQCRFLFGLGRFGRFGGGGDGLGSGDLLSLRLSVFLGGG